MDRMADIHICGSCRSHFTSVEAFLAHKRSGCLVTPNHHDMTNMLNAACTPLMTLHVPHPHAAISLQTGTQPSCTSAATQPREQPINPPAPLTLISKEAEHLTSATGSTCTTLSASSSSSNVTCTSAISGQEVDSADNQELPQSAKRSSSDLWRKTQTGDKIVQDTTADNAASKAGKKRKSAKWYKCTFGNCSFETAHLKDIIRHRRTHTGDKPFTCSICQRHFTRKDKLQLHVRAHNGDKPFTCKLCPYAAVDGGSLKKHIRTHTKEKPFKCQICSYASCNSSQLTTHLRTHTGDSPFHCQHCSAKFKISTDLKRHVRVHTGEKPFKCSICPYVSALKSNLKSHQRNNHFRDKNIQCKECSFTCCTKSQLKEHEKSHPSLSPGKSLDHTYYRHKCTHTADKSHRCSQCSIAAGRKSNRTPSPVKKVHPKEQKQPENPKKPKKARETTTSNSKRPKPSRRRPKTIQLKGKRPYMCESCDASFMRKDSYASHIKQHLKEVGNATGGTLEVLQPQELTPLQTQASIQVAPEGCSSVGACSSNQNQNNNVTLSQLLPTTSCSDFEVLLNVIASQAPVNPQPLVLHGTGTPNSAQNQASKSTCMSQNETTVTLANIPRVSSFPSNYKVVTHDAQHQSLQVTPGQASIGTCTGLGITDQQIILRQLPRLHPQIPQITDQQLQAPSTFHSVSGQQHLIQTLPVSLNVPSTIHQAFTPQFNGPPFPANQNTGNMLSSQSVASQTQQQGFRPPQPQPTEMLNQALGQALSTCVPLVRGGNYQGNVVMPCPLQTSSLQITAQPEMPRNTILNVTPQYQNI